MTTTTGAAAAVRAAARSVPLRRRPAARPGSSRRLPAVLLVVLAALASLLGSPAAASQAQSTSRPVVGGAPVTAMRLPLVAGHHGARDLRDAAVRRNARDRFAALAHGVAERVNPAGSGPSPAPGTPVLLLLVALVVVGRLVVPTGDRRVSGTVPVALRGRAPPAYALA